MNPADLSDEQLTRQAQQGDVKAFEQLVIRYQQPLFAFIYRMVNNQADAEDLCQQAFIRAWEKIASFQQKSSFKTWLFRIGINLALNYRHCTRHTEPLDEHLPANPDTEPESVFQRRNRKQLVRQALMQLAPDQRTALVLAVYENFSYQEIAGIMGKSVRAVDSLLVRARTRLRTLLEPARKKGLL
ncbi:MAG: RNA polymerase sigma factor [candidate division WOR-3 bacterium]